MSTNTEQLCPCCGKAIYLHVGNPSRFEFEIPKIANEVFKMTDNIQNLLLLNISLEAKLAERNVLIKKMIKLGWEMASVLKYLLGFGNYMRRWGKLVGESKAIEGGEE